MPRHLGGYIGLTPEPTAAAAGGVWTLREFSQASEWPPTVPPRVLYFDGSDDDNWFNLSNWWNDENHTDQATNLPKSSDSVVVTSTSIDTESGSEPTVANFTMNDPDTGYSLFGPLTVTGVATFNGFSSNLSDSLTGNAVFNDDSYSNNQINGNATYNDYSFNDGAVSGDAVFNGFSQHNFGATIGGNATFNNGATNEGAVGGNATFNNSATNEGAVLGDATFNDNSRHVGSVAGTATINDSACVDGGVAGTFVPDDPVNCNDI
jgi:hypothetical protein